MRPQIEPADGGLESKVPGFLDEADLVPTTSPQLPPPPHTHTRPFFLEPYCSHYVTLGPSTPVISSPKSSKLLAVMGLGEAVGRPDVSDTDMGVHGSRPSPPDARCCIPPPLLSAFLSLFWALGDSGVSYSGSQ